MSSLVPTLPSGLSAMAQSLPSTLLSSLPSSLGALPTSLGLPSGLPGLPGLLWITWILWIIWIIWIISYGSIITFYSTIISTFKPWSITFPS